MNGGLNRSTPIKERKELSIDPLFGLLDKIEKLLDYSIPFQEIQRINDNETLPMSLFFHDVLKYEDFLRDWIDEIEKGIFNRARTNISLRRNKEQFLGVVLAEKHFSLIIPFIKDIPNEFPGESKEEQELVKKMQRRIELYLSSLHSKVDQFLNFLCDSEKCGEQELEIIFLNGENK